MSSITRNRPLVQGASTHLPSYRHVFSDVAENPSYIYEMTDEQRLRHCLELHQACLEQQSLLMLIVSILYSKMTDVSTRLVALDLLVQAVQKSAKQLVTESMPVLIGGDSKRIKKDDKPCKFCKSGQEYVDEDVEKFYYSCRCGKTNFKYSKGIADRLGVARNTVTSACGAMVKSGALVREYRPGVKGPKQHLDFTLQDAFLNDPTIIQNKTIRKERTASSAKKSETCPACGSENVDVLKAHACHTCGEMSHTVVRKAPAYADVQQMQMDEHEVEATLQFTSAPSTPTPTSVAEQHGILVIDGGPLRPMTGTEQQPSTIPTSDVLVHDVQHATHLNSDVTEQFLDDAPPPPHQTQLLHANLEEPEMTGRWSNEKCVQYEEWKNKKRCRESIRPVQLAAAQWLHEQDPTLALEQFKLAYDEIFPWWRANNGPLHVSDMKTEQKNNIIRLYAMLDRIEARQTKTQVKKATNGRMSSSRTSPPSQRGTFTTNNEHLQEGENEQVLWSPLPEAIIDPLEFFASFRYMSLAEAKTYGYEPYKRLVPMDENNVLGKQRGQAAAAAKAQERSEQ